MTTAATTRTTSAATGTAVSSQARPPRWWRNPWRRPVLLESFTWLYLVWSLVPILLAVLFSFNSGKSQAVWQGFSLRWYLTDPVLSVAHSNVLQLAVLQTLKLSAYTTLIAVPLGVTFALGIHRWRTRTGATFNFVMLLSFVIPELIFGVAMFFVFTSLFSGVGLGTLAETLALVTWNVSWPAVIVQARLATIGNSYSEAAADLGCSPFQTMRRVMLPLLSPAIFASAILVFSTVIDDFVIVDLLSNTAANTPMSVYIYATQRGGNGGPALNALGTIMLVMSFVIAILGYFGFRLMTRGERGTSADALTTIAGS
jgi:spermidine/putrescine transport system permease protein